jgi:hypothetical protein
MNEKIPVKCLKLKKLGEVPRSEFQLAASPAVLNDATLRHAFLRMLRQTAPDRTPAGTTNVMQTQAFNVAAWLRISNASNHKISLLLHYRDATGEFGIVVDEANFSTSAALMLTGCVTFITRGIPEFIQVSCAGLQPDQAIFVDELYVQRATPQSTTHVRTNGGRL